MGGKASAQIIGYRYFLGLHVGLCHGPVDYILEVSFDERVAWTGVWDTGTILIDEPYLYGGNDREGGVSGNIELFQGDSTQVLSGTITNIYSPTPGFRGIVTLYLEQFYFGNNPYLKPMSFRISRIHTTSNGDPQWYDAKAEIPSADPCTTYQSGTGLLALYDWTDFSSVGWTTDDSSYWQIVGGHLLNAVNIGNPLHYYRYDETTYPARVVVEFRINSLGIYPGSLLILPGLFEFIPVYKTGGSITQYISRLFFQGDGSNAPYDVVDYPLSLTTWYQLIVDLDGSGGGSFELYDLSTGLLAGSSVMPGNLPLGTITSYGFQRWVSSANVDVIEWRRLAIYVRDTPTSVTVADMNPAHILRELHTDKEWGLGYLTSDIDDTAWTYAADYLYNEGLGLSGYWHQPTTIETMVDEVRRHINAEIYVSRSTGKFVLKLIREDYNINTIPVFDTSNIIRVQNYNKSTISELTNSVTVRYYDRCRKSKGSVSVQNPALAQIQQTNIHINIDFPMVMDFSLAARLAARELRTVSQPLISCTLEVNREGSILNKGDPFLLSWPKYGLQSVVMRVVAMDLGDGLDNKIKIQCVQDVFSLPDIEFVVLPYQQWVNPFSGTVTYADPRLVVEAPYYAMVLTIGQTNIDSILITEPDAGYLLAGAARPAQGYVTAEGIVNYGSGFSANPFSMPGYFGYAILDTSISYLTDTVTSISFQDIVFPSGQSFPSLGLPIFGVIENEIVQITDVSYDSGTGIATITIVRAVLDTVPTPHASGTYLLFTNSKLFSDNVQYVATEMLGVKILPIAYGTRLDPTLAPTDALTMNSRAIRPYPPGNVTLDGQRYPTGSLVGPLVLDWDHRDRLQQTSSTIIDQYYGDIGPEDSTVTYTIRIYDGTGTLVQTISGLLDGPYTIYPPSSYYNENTTVELCSQRGVYESWQCHMMNFFWSGGLMSSVFSSSSSNLPVSSSNLPASSSGGAGFFIQRAEITFGAAATSYDYTGFTPVASLTTAFVRLTNTAHICGGPTGSTADQQCDDMGAIVYFVDTSTIRIDNIAGPLEDRKYSIEIIEFLGAASDPDAIKVIQTGTFFLSGTNTDTVAVSGFTNRDNCVPFITGMQNSGTTSAARNLLGVCEWNSSDEIEFVREVAVGASTVSYAVVEFTGANWTIGHVYHTAAIAGDENPTIVQEIIKGAASPTTQDIGDWGTAWIETTVFASPSHGQRDLTGIVKPHATDTDKVTYHKYAGALYTAKRIACHIIQNPNITVQHVEPSDPGTDDNFNVTLGTSIVDLTKAIVQGTQICPLNTFNYTEFASNLYIVDVDTVNLWRHRDSGTTNEFYFSVVDLP